MVYFTVVLVSVCVCWCVLLCVLCVCVCVVLLCVVCVVCVVCGFCVCCVLCVVCVYIDERTVPTAGKSSGLIVREMVKDASENPRCVRESDVSDQEEEARVERPCW